MQRGYGKAVAARRGLRAAMMMDAMGLTLLVVAGAYLAAVGRTEAGTGIPQGLQIVTLASLIGCVATADKAVLRKRTVIVDVLGAGTWALAVVLTPVAMIQRLEAVAHSLVPMHLLMLVWLSLHGAVGVALAAIALRWREDRPLRRLRLWQRWLAVTGGVVLAFPYVLGLVAG